MVKWSPMHKDIHAVYMLIVTYNGDDSEFRCLRPLPLLECPSLEGDNQPCLCHQCRLANPFDSN